MNQKLLTNIARLLKADTVSLSIVNTSRGVLEMRMYKGKKDMELTLDSVPLDMKDENNQELHARIMAEIE